MNAEEMQYRQLVFSKEDIAASEKWQKELREEDERQEAILLKQMEAEVRGFHDGLIYTAIFALFTALSVRVLPYAIIGSLGKVAASLCGLFGPFVSYFIVRGMWRKTMKTKYGKRFN